jgi:hypothetical protein
MKPPVEAYPMPELKLEKVEHIAYVPIVTCDGTTVNVCGLATVGEVGLLAILPPENMYGRNVLPAVPTGCNVNPL